MLLLLICVISLSYLHCNSRMYDFDVKGDAEFGYYVTGYVGIPPQQVNLLLDTGSSNLAIASSRFKNGTIKYFVFNESSTFQSSPIKVDLRYTEGYWNGFLALDLVNLCRTENCSTISNIACMTAGNNIFSPESKFQGILGLGYPSIAKPDSTVEPFINTFIETWNESNIFALSLCGPYFSSTEKVSMCGKFHVGNYSARHFTGGVLYTPLVYEWYYEVTLINLKVGAKHMPFTCTELNKDRSTIDSGTTILSLPEIVYNWTINEIKKYTKQQFPREFWTNQSNACISKSYFNISAFPVITISIYQSDRSYFNLHISPELYILPVHREYDTCFKLGIGMSSYGTVIGSTILKGFYVIFDRKNKSVGFANATLNQNFPNFVAKVVGPYSSVEDFNKCRIVHRSNAMGISVLTIILLCLTVMCAVAVLYTLLSFIWKNFLSKSAEGSDTSSLVDND